MKKLQLVNIVREVIKEESKYQKFSKAVLEKAGKSIPQTSDDEKKKESVEIDEAKLSASQRDRLDDLILNVHMTTHPEYDGDEEPTKYLNMIRKEFGDEVAKQVSDGIDKMHWGRDNRSSGYDKLAWRNGGARITKSGKMNAQDVKALKNRIKRDKAWGGITKDVKLPEEIELDELSPATKDRTIKIENTLKISKSRLRETVEEVIKEVRDPESLRMAKDWADHGNVRFSEFINPESVNLYTGEDGAYTLEFTLSIPTQYDIEDIEDTFNFSSPASQPGGSFSRGNLFIGDEEPEDGYYQAEVSITGGYDV